MADALHNAEDFVADFDNEVGVLPRDLRSISRQTQSWPQYVDYMEGDKEILYEASMPVQGKAYTDIGWYLLLQPSIKESPTRERRTDAIASLQFRRNEQWHNTEDWHYLVWEVEMGKDPKKYALWKPDPGHIRMVMDSLKDFVDNKLTPILNRGKLQVTMSPKPTFAAESVAEQIVDLLLEGEVTRDRLNAVYNKLWHSANDTVKRANPCKIQKDAKGNVICVGCKEHPEHYAQPDKYDFQVQPNELCCTGCEHHGKKGCEACKPATCKTWLCPTAANQSPATADRLSDIGNRLGRVGLYNIRGSKMQAMDQAAWDKKLRPYDQPGAQSPVDDYMARMKGAMRQESRRQNRYNPKGLHRDHRGRLLDKWGRPMEVDWDDFEKRRGKQMNPLHNATTAIHKIGEVLESTDWDAKIRKLEQSTKKVVRNTKKTLKGWEKGLGKARPKN